MRNERFSRNQRVMALGHVILKTIKTSLVYREATTKREASLIFISAMCYAMARFAVDDRSDVDSLVACLGDTLRRRIDTLQM